MWGSNPRPLVFFGSKRLQRGSTWGGAPYFFLSPASALARKRSRPQALSPASALARKRSRPQALSPATVCSHPQALSPASALARKRSRPQPCAVTRKRSRPQALWKQTLATRQHLSKPQALSPASALARDRVKSIDRSIRVGEDFLLRVEPVLSFRSVNFPGNTRRLSPSGC